LSSLKLGLIYGPALAVLAGLLVSSPALAQAAPPAEPAAGAQPTAQDASSTDVDEVVVVGSRIRRDVYNSPSPVQVITREETTMAGYNSTTEALQGTAVTGGSAQINNAFGGFVTDGGPGANTLSLRGLGTSRTLVLLNGRRVAPAGSRGSVGSADLNVLPSAIIDHVEVLRDGASSIYGSDAVAGVVNIITERKVDGLTVEGQFNIPTHGAGEEGRFSVVGGTHGDRWSISGSAEYFQRNDLTLGDRDWTRCNTDYTFDRATGQRTDYIDPTTGLPKCYPITSTGSNGVTINTIGVNSQAGQPAAGAVGTNFTRFRPNSAVTTGLVGFEGVGGGANSLNVRDTFDPKMLNESLISPVKIFTAFGQGAYDLQALGGAQIYAEVLVNRRKSEQTGYRQLTLDYLKGSSLIPAGLQNSTFSSVPTETSSGQAVGVRAFIGFGNDRSDQTVDFLKTTAGLRGDLSFRDWRYDATVSYSRSKADYTARSFLTDRLTNSLNVVAAPAGFNPALIRQNASGGNVTCAINVTDPNAACIPAPVLNAATIGGQLPADYANYIFRPVTGSTLYTEAVATLALDGTLFELPAGKVKGAFGAEFRRATIDDQPPADSVNGNLYNLTSAAVTRGHDSVAEVYGEVEVPLLRDQFLAHDLTLNGSYRYTDYQSYGADKTYKIGGVWTPVKAISFRATYGTSFRAPALFEQFQGGTSGFFSSSTDPCNEYGNKPGTIRYTNCNAELNNPTFQATSGVAVITAGGAAQGLKAETSKNFTAGVILQPELPDGWGKLSFAADYYNIEVNNGVSRVGAGAILQLCYDDPQFRTGGGYCRFVDPRAAGSNALTVHDSYTNIATQIVRGLDFNLRYVQSVGPGRLRLNASLTKYLEQSSKLFSDDALDDVNGTINNPKYTGTFDATYAVANWSFRYGLEWIAAMDSYGYLGEDPATSDYVFSVPDYYLHTVSVQYAQGHDWSVTAGIRNLTDEKPPVISSGFYDRVGNSPLYSGYDYVGRTVFVNVSKSF
jgi:outer membrane receptor protein involved in Fe transport